MTGRLCLVVVALLGAAGISAQANGDGTGPNANIVRQASGHYAYRSLEDGRDRGEEHFQLFVHPDGSRTMIIWHDLRARDAQFTVVLRVAASFRPESAFVSYWVANGYKGNTLFRVEGNRLSANAVGVDGPVLRETEVPEQFSIGTHPVAADGWHLWYADAELATEGTLSLYSLEATADLAKPIVGQIVPMPYEIIGEETVETPAGTFPATRYRLAGSSDLWVTGADRLLVRMVQERFDREYVLMSLETRESLR